MILFMKYLRSILLTFFLNECLAAFPQFSFNEPMTIPGRPAPYFKNFTSQFVVKAEIIDTAVYKTYQSFDACSITLKVLDDFGYGLNDTITLYPDTVWYESGSYSWIFKLNNPIRNKEFYCDFHKNDENQYCYCLFYCIVDNKVLGMFTGFQYAMGRWLHIHKDGIKTTRFERRVSSLLKKRPVPRVLRK